MGKTYCLFVPWIPNQTFESHAAHFGIPIDYIILKSGVGSKHGSLNALGKLGNIDRLRIIGRDKLNISENS